MFWIVLVLALAVGAVVAGALLVLVGTPANAIGWVWTGGAFIFGAFIGFVVLSMGLNISRAMEHGSAEADRGRGDSLEATGRAAGAVVGKGLSAVTRSSRKKGEKPTGNVPAGPASGPPSAPAGSSTTPAEPKPEVTVDKAARVLGSMVGRRVAERRSRGDS